MALRSSPYRTPAHRDDGPPTAPCAGDGVLPWLLILVGASRVVLTLALAQYWGAEVMLCVGLMVLGVSDLVWRVRSHAGARLG